MMNAVEFDFAKKEERAIPVDAVAASCHEGRFCWVDIDADTQAEPAGKVLRELGVNEHVIDEIFGPDVDGRHDLYDDCLHIAVSSGTMDNGTFSTTHVDIVMGESFLVTLRRGKVDFIEQVRAHYRRDFLRFAQSPGFLLYEYWDHLIENYKKMLRKFEAEVEKVQGQIFGKVDDRIFAKVSAVTHQLLTFRKIMLAAREVIHELSTRRSAFVPESTQPFLDKLAGTLERLSADLAVEREILSETLNLYMGVTSHRTSRIVSRLTVVSMIFLPLTFLCGVYGMNFAIEREDASGVTRNLLMRELTWEYGYAGFWVVAVTTAVALLAFMRWKRWW